MPKMKVDDAEYAALSEAVGRIGTTAEEEIGAYFAALDTIIAEAVQQGEVHSALAEFIKQASPLKNLAGPLCAEIGGDCTNYTAEVDEKDQYLY